MLCLIVTHENDTRYFALPTGDFELGSSPDNDLVVPFPGVSHHHARVESGSDKVVRLVDLDSKNGLRVDGERVASIELRPGLKVQLGRAQLALDEASTSDLEVALAMGSSAGTNAKTGVAGDTGTWRAEEAPSDTVRALHLVREIEHLTPEERPHKLVHFLEKSVELVGARALLVASFHQGTLSLRACAGTLPGDRAWRQLEARVGEPQGRQTVSTILDSEDQELGVFLPPSEVDAPRLIAIFPNQRTALSAWRRDFIGYLACFLATSTIKR